MTDQARRFVAADRAGRRTVFAGLMGFNDTIGKVWVAKLDDETPEGA